MYVIMPVFGLGHQVEIYNRSFGPEYDVVVFLAELYSHNIDGIISWEFGYYCLGMTLKKKR